VYKISSDALNIHIDQFGVLPDSYNGDSLVDGNYSAYILVGSCTEPKSFDDSN